MYYGQVISITEHNTVHCLIQKGVGNTIKTSCLVSEYFPIEQMNGITKTNSFFILDKDGNITGVEETDKLISLFIPPDYFVHLKDSNFFNPK